MNEISNKKSGFSGFVLRHKMNTLLLLVLIVAIIWCLIKINTVQNQMIEERNSMINVYETKIDSLSASKLELFTKAFSLAVRGEMIRENMDQVNQFFNNIVKEPGIQKLQLIDVSTETILISTDKKEEGTAIDNRLILDAEKTINLSDENGFRIVSPVMGLNSKIGILVIEAEKSAKKVQKGVE